MRRWGSIAKIAWSSTVCTNWKKSAAPWAGVGSVGLGIGWRGSLRWMSCPKNGPACDRFHPSCRQAAPPRRTDRIFRRERRSTLKSARARRLGRNSRHPMTTADFDLPAFSAIRVANIEPVLRELLDAHRAQLAALLAAPTPSWDALVLPLEEMHHRLARTWSPVGHMNGVVNSDELRAAYNACLPLLTAWHTELAQNDRLYRAYETILANEGDRLTPGQRKLLQNALRDFRLAGVALPAEQKAEFKALVEQLATLQSKFDENVLDATNAWSRHVTQESELAGLPQPIIDRARAA